MGDQQQVLVTGASGFIAMQTIIGLLERGYRVRGTVRSLKKADSFRETLRPHSAMADMVELVEADLSSDKGWTEAAQGCDIVQHIASPIPENLPKNHDELIIPARDGTLRVLKAAKAAGVKRVVLTSSMAAIAYGWGDNRPEPLTEEHWSNSDNLQDNTAYTRSKTIAERAAWDYVNGEGQGLELTTINPGAVLGPVLSGDFSPSVQIVTQILSGKLPAMPKVAFPIADVRDVAEAHIRAMEKPEAAGKRFLIADRVLWFSEVASVLREALPDRAGSIPKSTLPNWVVKLMVPFNPALKQIIPELGKKRVISNEQLKSVLGIDPIKGEDAIKAAAKTLIEHKVV